MTRAPVRGAELETVDLILASHKHSDHLDPETLPDLMAASPTRDSCSPRSSSNTPGRWGYPAVG